MSKTTEVEIYLGEGVYVYEEIEHEQMDEAKLKNHMNYIIQREQIKSIMSNKNSLDYFKDKKEELEKFVLNSINVVVNADNGGGGLQRIWSTNPKSSINSLNIHNLSTKEELVEFEKLFLKNCCSGEMKKKAKVDVIFRLLQKVIDSNVNYCWTATRAIVDEWDRSDRTVYKNRLFGDTTKQTISNIINK